MPTLSSLKRLAPFLCLMLVLSFSSCRCAWPPDVGPVEGEDEATAAVEVSAEGRLPVG